MCVFLFFSTHHKQPAKLDADHSWFQLFTLLDSEVHYSSLTICIATHITISELWVHNTNINKLTASLLLKTKWRGVHIVARDLIVKLEWHHVDTTILHFPTIHPLTNKMNLTVHSVTKRIHLWIKFDKKWFF